MAGSTALSLLTAGSPRFCVVRSATQNQAADFLSGALNRAAATGGGHTTSATQSGDPPSALIMVSVAHHERMRGGVAPRIDALHPPGPAVKRTS
jgi:hypothetical protein